MADSLVVDAALTGRSLAPTRYLRAALAVGRSARRREYAVVYLSAGTFFRTDWLGALAARALINGRSDTEAVGLVERIEPGAGERVRRLSDVLNSWSAMTRVPPLRGSWRWQIRRMVALAIGPALSIAGQLSRLAPTAVLAWMIGVLLSTPWADHVWRCSRNRILNNLEASGYNDRPEAWLLDIGRRCSVEPQRNYIYMYLSTVLSPQRLSSLVERLIDRNSADALAAQLRADGATVGAFLHGPLCVAVPNALRQRGQEVVRAVAPQTHGMNISEQSQALGGFFGDSPETAVALGHPNASGVLLRHLNAGRTVYVALDELARERRPAATIEMLGQHFPRNDGPAWLAVRSGRPVSLWTTHCSPSGAVITSSPLVYPDTSLPVGRRVADLSERLYSHAEAAIRAHPDAWGCWNYLNLVKGTAADSAERSVNQTARVSATEVSA